MQTESSETLTEYRDFSSLRLGFENRALRHLPYPGLAKEVFYYTQRVLQPQSNKTWQKREPETARLYSYNDVFDTQEMQELASYGDFHPDFKGKSSMPSRMRLGQHPYRQLL